MLPKKYNIEDLKPAIEAAFNKLHLKAAIQKAAPQVKQVIAMLDTGKLRVAKKIKGKWVTQEWVKQAILIYFRLQKMRPIQAGELSFYDKIPLKKWTSKSKVRVVPHALVRKGAYIAPNTILMPSYVNIGAYVDEGTLVDTWATVGSCAQVGKFVHLSGGVGLGGVLEPLQARPVIVEDNVFIGSRSIIVEGVYIRKAAVIGAGVIITASTRIIDTTQKKATVYRGEVPENAIIISGHSSKKFLGGNFSIPCALIIGWRSQKTNLKISLNASLREIDLLHK